MSNIFENLNDYADIEILDYPKQCGFCITWSIKNFGFGELNLYYDKAKKEWEADTECLSKKTIEKILSMAIPQLAEKLMELDK